MIASSILMKVELLASVAGFACPLPEDNHTQQNLTGCLCLGRAAEGELHFRVT